MVPLDALEAARVPPPAQDPPVLPYLQVDEPWGLDLTLEVAWNGEVVSRPPFAGMYWTVAQQLAHLTVNGASLRTGDLFASGTVSGPDREQRGSFLELSWNGVGAGDARRRLDAVLPRGRRRGLDQRVGAGADGARIGFGAVTGRVLPTRGMTPRPRPSTSRKARP